MGFFEQADSAGRRPGKRAFHVPEELTLEEVLGERGAVHRHERHPRAAALRVDGARDDPLAAPGLPEQEHGNTGVGHAHHELRHVAHGDAATDEVPEREAFLERLLSVSASRRRRVSSRARSRKRASSSTLNGLVK